MYTYLRTCKYRIPSNLILLTSFSIFLISDSTSVSSIFHHGCALNPASLITDHCHSDGNSFSI